jgi:chromosome segregation ATPase
MEGNRMALFSFRTREPQRDRETDRARFDKLLKLFQQLLAEIEAERDGLKSRYGQTQASAAFALDAFENGDGEELSAKADDLALAMRRYRVRIAALEGQLAFLQRSETEINAYYDTLVTKCLEPKENSDSKNVAVTADD